MRRAGRVTYAVWTNSSIKVLCPLCDYMTRILVRGGYVNRAGTCIATSTHICRDGAAAAGFLLPCGLVVRVFPRRREYDDDVLRELAC